MTDDTIRDRWRSFDRLEPYQQNWLRRAWPNPEPSDMGLAFAYGQTRDLSPSEFRRLYMTDWAWSAPEPEPVVIGVDLASQSDATVTVIRGGRQCGRQAARDEAALRALAAGQRVLEASSRYGFREVTVDHMGRLIRKPARAPGRRGRITYDEFPA